MVEMLTLLHAWNKSAASAEAEAIPCPATDASVTVDDTVTADFSVGDATDPVIEELVLAALGTTTVEQLMAGAIEAADAADAEATLEEAAASSSASAAVSGSKRKAPGGGGRAAAGAAASTELDGASAAKRPTASAAGAE